MHPAGFGLAKLAKYGRMEAIAYGGTPVQVNVLEAKSQLSKLVKAALEGEEVIIARNGEPMVKLVPMRKPRKLGGWRRLKKFAGEIDGAFTPEVDAEIGRMIEDDR